MRGSGGSSSSTAADKGQTPSRTSLVSTGPLQPLRRQLQLRRRKQQQRRRQQRRRRLHQSLLSLPSRPLVSLRPRTRPARGTLCSPNRQKPRYPGGPLPGQLSTRRSLERRPLWMRPLRRRSRSLLGSRRGPPLPLPRPRLLPSSRSWTRRWLYLRLTRGSLWDPRRSASFPCRRRHRAPPLLRPVRPVAPLLLLRARPRLILRRRTHLLRRRLFLRPQPRPLPRGPPREPARACETSTSRPPCSTTSCARPRPRPPATSSSAASWRGGSSGAEATPRPPLPSTLLPIPPAPSRSARSSSPSRRGPRTRFRPWRRKIYSRRRTSGVCSLWAGSTRTLPSRASCLRSTCTRSPGIRRCSTRPWPWSAPRETSGAAAASSGCRRRAG